jgi:1,4-alpha-glucan branching enzyme
MLPQQNITGNTPLGATVISNGASFRVWAPRATAVYLKGTFDGTTYSQPADDRLLAKDANGYWAGFQAGAQDGDPYTYWVVGPGSSGDKRDPRARELSSNGFPDSNSILRDANAYPWHDAGFLTPDFSDLIIYQLHIGTYSIQQSGVASNFLDVIGKLPYLEALRCNMLQPLPIDEQEDNPGMGYEGADLFSPDFPYVCTDQAALAAYLTVINGLLASKNQTPLRLTDIQSGTGQLKALVDLCHLHGIAVAFDVVYNHAGGFSSGGKADDNCLYYFDRVANQGNNNDSLYFTDQDRHTGGLAFALWNDPVAQLLLDNARFFIEECHVDGFRYDEISILLSTNQTNGWEFCRNLTTQNRGLTPRILQNAEFWPGEFGDIPNTWAPIVAGASGGGAGFDVVQHDALRGALRNAVQSASYGASAALSMSSIASVLYPPNFDHAWRAVTCIENHDVVYAGRQPRIPALADPSNHRSWYARSRTRAATSILLTAPGIPQLFMGEEFLEDKPWDENPNGPNLIWWYGLNSGQDRAMSDHLRFTQDLIRLRRQQPALRGDLVHPFYSSDQDRVLAFHRWLEGTGQDIIVVASFAESTYWDYHLGFPSAGFWAEVFNSDVYDNWVNPVVAGNGTGVWANNPGMHGFTASASVVIPANGVVVFARQ